ncbi:MAG: elongation factor P maturation arginine rhamnosyltransferase EarP [Candidatus Accumulibacter sp.]|jgi:uncharacterized repeat protein (TIGR03837 family)|nr:elongation factor P maturation arginine rhamnosyltransferase EarP [Accumulibacter sp.]
MNARRWDIFCAVIDNYGDIGVAWRLARQLAGEYGFSVRLWVDDLSAFQKLCPEISLSARVQNILSVEVRAWDKTFPEDAVPGQVVIEAFGCRLPESFMKAMAERSPPPVWTNLEYLSAETWVETCHALPSPHPVLPLVKHFFFPGFTEKTGGLLRERGLDARRRTFAKSQEPRDFFQNAPETDIRSTSDTPPLTVFLFAYENAALPDLLDFFASGTQPVRCLIPPSRPAAGGFSGISARQGKSFRRGNLEVFFLPSFVPQTEFDKLLWMSDVNFIRGEDSFIRAQWAEKPFVWHIYPQEEKTHLVKLDAFLDLFCNALPREASNALRAFHHAWNENRLSPEICSDWMASLPQQRPHAKKWAKFLKKQDDLCRSLTRFCLSRL